MRYEDGFLDLLKSKARLRNRRTLKEKHPQLQSESGIADLVSHCYAFLSQKPSMWPIHGVCDKAKGCFSLQEACEQVVESMS